MVPNIVQAVGKPGWVGYPAGLGRIVSLVSGKGDAKRTKLGVQVRRTSAKVQGLHRCPLGVMKSGGDPTLELR